MEIKELSGSFWGQAVVQTRSSDGTEGELVFDYERVGAARR